MKEIILRLMAVDVDIPCAGGGCNPEGEDLIASVLGWVYFAIGVVGAIIIIVAGIQYMTSAGEPEKTKTARQTIVYTVVGMIVAFSAATIIGFVTGAFS